MRVRLFSCASRTMSVTASLAIVIRMSTRIELLDGHEWSDRRGVLGVFGGPAAFDAEDTQIG